MRLYTHHTQSFEKKCPSKTISLLKHLLGLDVVPRQKELDMHSNHDRFSDFRHCNDQEPVQYGMQLSRAFPKAEAVYPLQQPKNSYVGTGITKP